MTESDTRRMFRIAISGRRKTLGLTQRGLVDKLADIGFPMHQSALAKIEKGDREPKIDEVAALATVLGLRLDEILVSPEGQRKRQISSAHGFVMRARRHLAGAALEVASLVGAAKEAGTLEADVRELLSDEFLVPLWNYMTVTVPDEGTAKLASELVGRVTMNLVVVRTDDESPLVDVAGTDAQPDLDDLAADISGAEPVAEPVSKTDEEVVEQQVRDRSRTRA